MVAPGGDGGDGKCKLCDEGLDDVEVDDRGDGFGVVGDFGLEEEGFFESGPEFPV